MEVILASIKIPVLFAILKNYQEIIEKNFQKRDGNLTLNIDPMVRKLSSGKLKSPNSCGVTSPPILGQIIDKYMNTNNVLKAYGKKCIQ